MKNTTTNIIGSTIKLFADTREGKSFVAEVEVLEENTLGLLTITEAGEGLKYDWNEGSPRTAPSEEALRAFAPLNRWREDDMGGGWTLLDITVTF